MLLSLGRIDEAIDRYERAIARKPDSVEAYKGLLSAILYHPDLDPEAVFAIHRRFEERLARPRYARIRPHRNVPDPERRLKIGYLSSDFRVHSVARNLIPIFRGHDRSRFDIHCYAEVPRPDAMTGDFRALADGWRSTVGLRDEEVAEAIRDDRIDILVCLAGRFDGNRLLVPAFKPAPVQVSYYDAATSGLDTMDYLLSDRVLTPRTTPERFTERPLCLPTFYVGEMPPDPPPVASRNGPVVFGCLNNPAKITGPVLDLWMRVLREVPGSLLLLKYLNWYETPSVRDRVLAAFDRHGLDRDRLRLPEAARSLHQHLALYNEIDIALDPFPFSGSTTTFEALLMGVPVVALRGRSMMGGWSAGMLRGLGLAGLIAAGPEDYLALATGLAADPDRRAALRATLRDRVAASPLCDRTRKAGQIERFYRAVWRRWCAAQVLSE